MILFYEDTNAINLAKADINRFQFAFNCLWGLVGNLFLLFYLLRKKKTFRLVQMHLKEEGLIDVFCFIQQKQEMIFQNAWPGKPSSAQPY